MAGAGAAGAALGGTQGAISTDKLADIPEEAATGALYGGIGGAGSQAIATGLAKGLPALARMIKGTPKELPGNVDPGSVEGLQMAAAAEAAKKAAAAARAANPVVQLTLPAGGATLGGLAGYTGAFKTPNASTDAPSSLADKMIDTGEGMAAGATIGALSKNARPMISDAGKVIGTKVSDAGKAIGTKVGNMISDEANQGADPFGKLGKWFAAGKESPNASVAAQAAKIEPVLENADNDTAREIAMDMTTTPEKRAVVNSESPVHNEVEPTAPVVSDTTKPTTQSQLYQEYMKAYDAATNKNAKLALGNKFEQDLKAMQAAEMKAKGGTLSSQEDITTPAGFFKNNQ